MAVWTTNIQRGQASAPSTRRASPHAIARPPLCFEQNRGQAQDGVKFLSRGPGYSLSLKRQEAVLNRAGEPTLTMQLVGCNPEPRVTGRDELPGKVNYYRGSNPDDWQTAVPTYGEVEYQDVYPGVDLVYHGAGCDLEYDFIVAPGGDPADIRLRFEGTDSMEIDDRGDLVLHVSSGVVRHRKPVLYQEREEIHGSFVIRGDEVGFDVGAYDSERPLVIDPVLTYSSYFGGSDFDIARGSSAIDADGNVYFTGLTRSTDLPIADNVHGAVSGTTNDVFVMKLNIRTNTLVYSTFLGGSANDSGTELALDGDGNAYITGFTSSADYPTTPGSVQPVKAEPGFDCLITKLDPSGALVFSTFLGGKGNGDDDGGWAITVDENHNVLVAGGAYSLDFPMKNPIQGTNGGGRIGDAFVAKLTASGDDLIYSTYLGGDLGDLAACIATDAAGNAYVGGYTRSTNFPIPNAIQPAYGGGIFDAFLTKIDPNGTEFVFSTYFGGNEYDRIEGIEVDADGNIYVTGPTSSTDFPTANPIQASLAGDQDTFVTKFDSTGQAVLFSTYLGGTNRDGGQDLGLDAGGYVYLVGGTWSSDFPLINPFQDTFTGMGAIFVARIDTALGELDYSTLVGNDSPFSESGIDVGATGNVTITGSTRASDFPTVDPFQATLAGANDVVVARIELSDTDGDGIPDLWESKGYTHPSGAFVDLPALGADPLRKDIFVEVDYMQDDQFNHRPMQAAIDEVIAAFAAAGVDNPDGSTGITLHVMIDDALPYSELLGSESAPGAYDWDGTDPGVVYFQALKEANFAEEMAVVAHYCVFAHKLDFGDQTVSGMSRGSTETGFAASEFIVSLGGVGVGGLGSVNQQAGTFMHELGHDLGLRHGGGDSVNFKPNYLSVMNHAFQMSGLIHEGSSMLLDFSCCKLPDLDENGQLDEAIGLDGGAVIAGLGTKWFCAPDDPRTTANANGPIDWDCDGSIDTTLVQTDINADDLPAGFSAAPVLTGFNDWEAIVFRGGAVGATGATAPPPPPTTEPPPEVDEDVVATLGPPAPGKLKSHAAKNMVTLSWQAVEAPGSSGLSYNVYRANSGELDFLGNTTRTNFHDKTSVPGTEYEYSVTTVDTFGTEGPPTTVNAMAR
ncbi:MAG: DUF7948 domain-containing protein [Planctomycetota bacterium]